MNSQTAQGRKTGRVRVLVCSSLTIALSGCMVGPNPHPPIVAVPATYSQVLVTATNAPEQDLALAIHDADGEGKGFENDAVELGVNRIGHAGTSDT